MRLNSEILKDGSLNFLQEVRQRLQDDYFADINAARYEEREASMALAAMAMLDAGVDDNTITSMLQKYWDLRLSEALPIIKHAHKQLDLQ